MMDADALGVEGGGHSGFAPRRTAGFGHVFRKAPKKTIFASKDAKIQSRQESEGESVTGTTGGAGCEYPCPPYGGPPGVLD
jgi:hypothetical protein